MTLSMVLVGFDRPRARCTRTRLDVSTCPCLCTVFAAFWFMADRLSTRWGAANRIWHQVLAALNDLSHSTEDLFRRAFHGMSGSARRSRANKSRSVFAVACVRLILTMVGQFTSRVASDDARSPASCLCSYSTALAAEFVCSRHCASMRTGLTRAGRSKPAP